MSEWREYTVKELIDLDMLEPPMDGNHGGIHPKTTDYVPIGVPFIMANNLIDGTVDLVNCAFISEEQANTLRKGFSKPGDVLLTHKATMGRTAIVPDTYPLIILTPQVTYYRIKKGINNKYLKYYFDSPEFQSTLESWANSGSTRAYLGITAQQKLPIILPSLVIQEKIADILGKIDDKISVNNQINRNLSEQALALFKEMFPDVNQGDHTLGEYLSAVKGKALLSKDAIEGSVPVIAGGLSPATYHNVANTKAPVLTISASGANAGYVALWHVDVWSSDSSYIDSNMTENVYFWYAMLKTRQKEIFDAQTGSAQPHIYPKNIDVLPVAELDGKVVADYTIQVSPLFELMGNNILENERLSGLRDTLLPKLMSGELDVSELDI